MSLRLYVCPSCGLAVLYDDGELIVRSCPSAIHWMSTDPPIMANRGRFTLPVTLVRAG